MAKSKIEWTDSTWNPVTGCTKISPGCKNCYAERMAERLKAMGQPNYVNGFKVREHYHVLNKPSGWKNPRKIFVNSMSDIFHYDVSEEFIRRIFVVMNTIDQHTYQVLTKRPQKAIEMSRLLWWTPNIWMGVSVENSDYQSRIELLKEIGAKVKFLSLEPLLGPLTNLDLDGIDWVIVGGELGPGVRPMEVAWAEEILAQCRDAGVPFFMKQMSKGKEIPERLMVREFPA